MNPSTEKYLSKAYDLLPFPINVIDENGNIVYVNQAFRVQWGFGLSELKEYSVFEDSELIRLGILTVIKQVFQNKNFAVVNNYIDTLLKNRDTAYPIFRTNIFHITIEEENYALFFHEDQTEIILAEEEVKRARDINKEAERLKNNFLNVLSHELRTPLNIVLGYASILRETLEGKLSEEEKVYIENLKSGSERLFNSITQMLDFAQIESGIYSLNIETIDLISLLSTCINSIRKNAEEKHLKIKTQFSRGKIFVDVDYQSVENAVNNLLNNAIKFTRQGFIEIETDILVEKELAVCKIRDSGIGISADYMEHLFQPFSQEDLHIGRNYEGNGLGLALVKRYIEKMGGSLVVDSIKGVGSTFTFTLPLSAKHLKHGFQKESEKKEELQHALMIDESNESNNLLRAFLKNQFLIQNFDHDSFNTELLNDKKYTVIIFDVNQNSWKEGLSLCRQIKSNDPYKRPILILSSEYLEEKIQEFYDAGANKFLIKPFTKKDLITSLHDIIER
jgi:PAS domain S-box-containing protein